MRYATRRKPTPEQVALLNSATECSFVPMEAVGEHGTLDLSRTRLVDDVRTGYTLFFDNDVVIAKITPCFENGKGAVARNLTNGVAFGTTELFVLGSTESLVPDFLYYLTYSEPFRKQGEAQMSGAAGQKRITDEFVRNFRFRLPPLEVQRRIAAYLDRETSEIDRLIAAKERLLNLLAEKRRALITHAVTKGFRKCNKVDSGVAWIGQVPELWRVERLKSHLRSITQGWSPQCDNYPAADHEWGVLKVGAVNGWKFDESEQKRLPEDLDPIPQYEVKPGDILMSRANTTELVGRVVVIGEVRSKLMFCDKHYRIEISLERIDARYLFWFLRSPAGHFEFERDASGASNSMQNISQESVRNVWIALPPLEEQREIVGRIEESFERFDELEEKMQRSLVLSRERRSSLISAAVTGEIEVK